jgi:WD40 repeat protein
VLALGFCGSGLLAAGTTANTIHLWDLGSREELCRLTGHTGSVATLLWNAGSGELISGGFDCTIRSWHLKKEDIQ